MAAVVDIVSRHDLSIDGCCKKQHNKNNSKNGYICHSFCFNSRILCVAMWSLVTVRGKILEG